MKISTPIVVAVLAAFTLLMAGCQKKPDVDSELEKAAKVLLQPDSNQASAPAVVPPPPPAENPAATPAQQTPVAVTAQVVTQQMNQAMTSSKGGNYEDAVTRLQWLRSKAPKTPEQSLALQEAMAAVMGEIYARAARGDARAKQAVKQYEQLQNAR